MFDWVLNAHLNIVVSFIGVSVNNDMAYDNLRYFVKVEMKKLRIFGNFCASSIE